MSCCRPTLKAPALHHAQLQQKMLAVDVYQGCGGHLQAATGYSLVPQPVQVGLKVGGQVTGLVAEPVG